MENLENVRVNNIYTDNNSFYTEIASFTGSDVKEEFTPSSVHSPSETMESQWVNRENIYKMRIKLFRNENFIGNIYNELLLDNTWRHYNYIENTAHLDGRWFNPNLHLDRVLTSVYSNNEDSLVELSLSRVLREGDFNFTRDKIETRGFKLSEIISGIGDFNELRESDVRSSAEISIFQNTFLINRCFSKYVVFNFKLLNTGNEIGQNVLFKNIFPNNIILNDKWVFINGNRVDKKYLDFDNNKLLVRLPNINPKENLNLTIVGCLSFGFLNFNFGCISYVSRVFRNMNVLNVDISQKVTNTKIL